MCRIYMVCCVAIYTYVWGIASVQNIIYNLQWTNRYNSHVWFEYCTLLLVYMMFEFWINFIGHPGIKIYII